MPTVITGVPATSHGDPITFNAPADTEAADAASVVTPIQALADVVAHLQAHTVKLDEGTNDIIVPTTVIDPTVAGEIANRGYVLDREGGGHLRWSGSYTWTVASSAMITALVGITTGWWNYCKGPVYGGIGSNKGALYVSRDGLYLVMASVLFHTSSAAITNISVGIAKGGGSEGATIGGGYAPVVSGSYQQTTVQIGGVISCTNGDRLEVFVTAAPTGGTIHIDFVTLYAVFVSDI